MKKPIKILFIIDSLRRGGGTQKVLVQLLVGLKQRGYLPTVVSLTKGDHILIRDLKKKGMEIIDYNRLSLILFGVVKIFLLILREKFEIIQSFLFYSNVIGRILGRLAQAPVIVSSVRGFQVEGLKMKGWQIWLENLTNRLSDKVTINTKLAKEFCINELAIIPEKLEVIYNGIELPPSSEKPDIFKQREKFGIGKDKIILGTVGRLTVEKGHTYLLNALKIALKSDPRLYLLIVGEGKLMKNLVHQARELEIKQNLKFTGYQEDMRPIYELIDVFVLPSLSEGMPNAVMEAMAWGKPIVASAVGGVLELIEHQVTGILIPPGDPEKLAEALTKIARNIEWANQIGQNARFSVIRKYNLDIMVDSYSNLYDQLLGQIYSLYH